MLPCVPSWVSNSSISAPARRTTIRINGRRRIPRRTVINWHAIIWSMSSGIQAVRRIREAAPAGIAIAGCAYSYLQDYLPHVTQYLVREGWVDNVGLGRMVLSYPDMLPDAMAGAGVGENRRTFSDCTTGPRKLISGCFPLDDYYKSPARG